MLYIHRNDIVVDQLDDNSSYIWEDAKDEDFIEVRLGDESIVFELGDTVTLDEMQPGDRFVSSYVVERDIPFTFEKTSGYYRGEYTYTRIK